MKSDDIMPPFTEYMAGCTLKLEREGIFKTKMFLYGLYLGQNDDGDNIFLQRESFLLHFQSRILSFTGR